MGYQVIFKVNQNFSKLWIFVWKLIINFESKKIVRLTREMLITIKNMKGEVQELEVRSATSVAQIGTMIAEQNQIPADTLKLIYRKKQLQKNKTASYYNMQTGDTIVFMINTASPKTIMASPEITPQVPAQTQNLLANLPTQQVPLQSHPAQHQASAGFNEEHARFHDRPEREMQAQAYNPRRVQLSYAHSDAVLRLQAFGFPEVACYEAYWVCRKDEEMALSMLFDIAN